MPAISRSARRIALVGVGAAALIGTSLAGVAGASPSAQTSTVVVDSTSAGTVTLPSVNRNFSETVTVSQGTAQTTTWCPFGCSTTYTDGTESTTNPGTIYRGGQVGSVQYEVGNGPWIEITSPNTVISGQGTVQLRYNDGADSLSDNTGSYTVTVVRTGS